MCALPPGAGVPHTHAHVKDHPAAEGVSNTQTVRGVSTRDCGVTNSMPLVSTVTAATSACRLLPQGHQGHPAQHAAHLRCKQGQPALRGPYPAKTLRSSKRGGQESGAGDGALLVGTAKGVFVCRLLPEGRLAIVHSIPRPPEAREGCLPSAAWRPRPPEAGRPASALLAVAWERSVALYDVPLRPAARAPSHNAGSPSRAAGGFRKLLRRTSTRCTFGTCPW